MTTDVTIRLATHSDLPELRRRARWLDYENQQYGQASVELDIVQDLQHALDTGQEVIVAENSSGDVIGFCAWVCLPLNRPGQAMGVGTVVASEYRRSGVSRRMRDMMEQCLRARGITSVVGVAAAGNWAGLESALKQGFRVTGWVVEKEFRDEEVGIEGQRIEDGQREGHGPKVLLN